MLPACLCAGLVGAQTPPSGAAAQCPSLDPSLSADLRWESFSTPDMLFCKAILESSGEEAFALTISPESPFRPRRNRRAEVGRLGGIELQWYRSEVLTAPQDIVREALITTADGRKAHIFMRATDADAVARRQRMVETLDIARSPDDD